MPYLARDSAVNRRLALIGLAVGLAIVLAACGAPQDETATFIDDPDKPHITIDATFGTTEVEGVGRQNVWLSGSSGWDPCPEQVVSDVPPSKCWIFALVDGIQVSVLFPEPDGRLGPFPIAIHFGVFAFKPGAHELQLVQRTDLDIRETAPVTLQVRAPNA